MAKEIEMTTMGKVVTWQAASIVLAIAGSVVGTAFAFDRRIEERVAPIAEEVRRVSDDGVRRREFDAVRDEVRAGREKTDAMAVDLAAIRAILDERLPARRRR